MPSDVSQLGGGAAVPWRKDAGSAPAAEQQSGLGTFKVLAGLTAVMLIDTDLPALFRAADACSREGQHAYGWAIGTILAGSMVTAVAARGARGADA